MFFCVKVPADQGNKIMQPLLKVQALSKTFNMRAGLFSRKKFDVLKNISFCIGKGETIAIIGETLLRQVTAQLPARQQARPTGRGPSLWLPRVWLADRARTG